jgi:hypothetical protein
MSIDPIKVDLDDAAREVAGALNAVGAKPIRGEWIAADEQDEQADDLVWDLG